MTYIYFSDSVNSVADGVRAVDFVLICGNFTFLFIKSFLNLRCTSQIHISRMSSDISDKTIVSSISSRKLSISSHMAATGDRKRKRNVRPASSCSNFGSNENSMETGYASDNSFITMDAANGIEDNEGSNVSRKKPRCENKNAVNARLNREKKKEYTKGLEQQLESLREENFRLKTENKSNMDIIQKLQEEVTYFESAVANRSEISMLLKCIPKGDSPHMSSGSITNSESESRFGAGLMGDPFLSSTALKELSQDDLVEQNISVESMEEITGGSSNFGICVHVAKGRTSLQLCVHCNSSAALLWNDQIG